MAQRGRTGAIGAVGVVALLGVAAVGCSSSGTGDGAAASSTTTAPPATAPPTTQDVAADEAIAEAALLTVDELPGGAWTVGDERPRSASDGFDCPELADDAAFFNEHAKGAPGAKAPELTDQATTASLQLDVNIVGTDADAERVSAFFSDPKFAGCLESRFEDQASSSTASPALALSDVAIEPADLGAIGDSSAGWTISFTASNGSQEAAVTGLLVFVQVGRGFTTISMIGQQAPVTAADVEPIAAAAAAKLETALADA